MNPFWEEAKRRVEEEIRWRRWRNQLEERIRLDPGVLTVKERQLFGLRYHCRIREMNGV
jgi:hypothetical protein